MKYKLKYSPDASDKLKQMKSQINDLYGWQVADRIISKIISEIRGLQNHPEKGVSVENALGIPAIYRCLHTEHNYVFYKIKNDTVFVTDIYSEREDFMRKMFGINLRTQESIDFWGE